MLIRVFLLIYGISACILALLMIILLICSKFGVFNVAFTGGSSQNYIIWVGNPAKVILLSAMVSPAVGTNISSSHLPHLSGSSNTIALINWNATVCYNISFLENAVHSVGDDLKYSNYIHVEIHFCSSFIILKRCIFAEQGCRSYVEAWEHSRQA